MVGSMNRHFGDPGPCDICEIQVPDRQTVRINGIRRRVCPSCYSARVYGKRTRRSLLG